MIVSKKVSNYPSVPTLLVFVGICLMSLALFARVPLPTSPTFVPVVSEKTSTHLKIGTLPSPPINARLKPVDFASLPGWKQDNMHQALSAFLHSCVALIEQKAWAPTCLAARAFKKESDASHAQDMQTHVRQFFETWTTPYQILFNERKHGLVTGYYEPLLYGSRRRHGIYQTPLHAVPDDLISVDLAATYPHLKNMRLRGRLHENKLIPYFTRAQLRKSDVLVGKEIVWVSDPVDAFFLHVQGSGRVQLPPEEGGGIIRLAYANQNGHPYRSIGRYLIEQGELASGQASMQTIKAWIAVNPTRTQALFDINPSYVFFQEASSSMRAISEGPSGALGVPLTPMRSVAVDPTIIPLGLPLFLFAPFPGKCSNTSCPDVRALVMAQDIGSAIQGVGRVDFFWGFGDKKGQLAGKMRQPVDIWILLPK